MFFCECYEYNRGMCLTKILTVTISVNMREKYVNKIPPTMEKCTQTRSQFLSGRVFWCVLLLYTHGVKWNGFFYHQPKEQHTGFPSWLSVRGKSGNITY